MPREFTRQPRSLLYIDRWKETEFRQFLLYTGSIVLKDGLTENVYRHILEIMTATSILLQYRKIVSEMNTCHMQKTIEVLVYFIKKAKSINGAEFT